MILGEDELAAGKVRVKELGLEEGHPEKEGVLVDISSLVDEVRSRLVKKRAAAPTSTSTATAGNVMELAQKLDGVKVETATEAPTTEGAGV